MLRCRRCLLWLGDLCALSLGLLSRGAPLVQGSFAGHVNHSQELLSQITSDHKAIAYVRDRQRVAHWWSSDPAVGGALAVPNSAGARLRARLTKTQVTGAPTLPGGHTFRFSGSLADGENDCFCCQQIFNGGATTSSWVALSPTEQAGAVLQRGTIVASPMLTAGQPTVRADDVGALAIQPVDQYADMTMNG